MGNDSNMSSHFNDLLYNKNITINTKGNFYLSVILRKTLRSQSYLLCSFLLIKSNSKTGARSLRKTFYRLLNSETYELKNISS